MNKFEYNRDDNEKLTAVRVDRVWLKKELLPKKSEFKEIYSGAWKLFNEGLDIEDYPFSELKQMIVGNDELFIIIISTEGHGNREVDDRKVACKRIRQNAFLTDKQSFIDITMLFGFKNLDGCRFQHLHSPFEDFANEFIGEKYF